MKVRLKLSNDPKEHKKLVRDFWGVVEKLVIQEYDEIKTMSMRDSYYHIAIELEKLKGDTITILQYKYFWEEQTYFYYTQDKWSNWEKKHSIVRPQTKNYTVMIENGQKKILPEKIDEIYFRTQGFIYVEKAGKADDLSLLSQYGWVILGAQGQSQRLLREILKADVDKKPILVFHDADKAGELIKNVFIDGSRRTEHLDLTFDNVFDLGLTLEDAENLDLTLIPDPKGGMRAEINALLKLKTTRGLKNPFLWYVVTRMKDHNIPLCPKPISKKRLLKTRLSFQVEEVLRTIIEKAVDRSIENVEDKELINIKFPDQEETQIENQDLENELYDVAIKLVDSAKEFFEADFEQKIIDLAEMKI